MTQEDNLYSRGTEEENDLEESIEEADQLLLLIYNCGEGHQHVNDATSNTELSQYKVFGTEKCAECEEAGKDGMMKLIDIDVLNLN